MKRKSLFLVFCLALTAIFIFSPLAFASDEIKVYINDEQLKFDVAPAVVNQTTLVPMRAIFEGLGAKVAWDGNAKTIIGTKDDTIIILELNSSSATKNGQTVILSTPSEAINNRTMVPLRFISESFDCNVAWDAATRTINITAADVYGRSNPAPVGTEQTIKISNYSQEYTVVIKVNSITRGETAWDELYEANQFNTPPTADTEYIIINVTATLTDVADSSSVYFNYFDFDRFSNTDVEYTYQSVVIPDPVFSGDVYEGGTISGNIVMLVNKTDDNPKIVYGRKYDGTGGIWFSIK